MRQRIYINFNQTVGPEEARRRVWYFAGGEGREGRVHARFN